MVSFRFRILPDRIAPHYITRSEGRAELIFSFLRLSTCVAERRESLIPNGEVPNEREDMGKKKGKSKAQDEAGT